MHRGKSMWKKAAAMLLGTLFMAMSPAVPAQVDVSPFVERDSFNDIKISPTGEYFAMTVWLEDQTGLVVMRRSDGELTATFRFRGGTHVDDFWWVNDDRVLMSISESFGSRDDPLPTGELFAMNADGGRRELLVGWRVASNSASNIRGAKRAENVAAFLIDPMLEDERHVLIAVQPLAADPHTRVERMDVYSGRRVQVTRAPVQRARFLTDSRGEVRFAVGAGSNNVSQLYYREGAGSEWTLVNDELATGRIETPLGFSEDDALAYLQVEHPQGPDSVVAMDVATGERRELMRDEVVDPWPIYRDGGGPLIGVRYLGGEVRTSFLDEKSEDARLYRSLEAAFPGHAIDIASATADGNLKLVLARSDVEPGSIYLYDNVAKKADFVLARREQIDPANMAPMRPVTIQARDGLALHGFLTVPKRADGGNLPLVVMPHGGPFGVFDGWGFNSDTQLLARAGYAVLRVNFRGSGNYGRSFRFAGARQWGRSMQDDLTDATHWAISEGIADPGRICIYGASYGGYAALMGAAREPDLYRCAVGYVGVYDLPRMVRENAQMGRWATTWSREWVGDDTEALAAVSPDRLAEHIRIPVFLAAGGEDQVAPIAHSESMERALKQAGVPVETLYYRTEGHGFHAVENRRGFYDQLLDFLGRHLGEPGLAGP
ncbi:MAG: S9 family peptidase [Gammaproteobacteria bacterium]|nr:S9 family peptidase [Gammaproteobacteria bacterium]